jgi:hypothetical protein
MTDTEMETFNILWKKHTQLKLLDLSNIKLGDKSMALLKKYMKESSTVFIRISILILKGN